MGREVLQSSLVLMRRTNYSPSYARVERSDSIFTHHESLPPCDPSRTSRSIPFQSLRNGQPPHTSGLSWIYLRDNSTSTVYRSTDGCACYLRYTLCIQVQSISRLTDLYLGHIVPTGLGGRRLPPAR